jgi:hypothetical protein
MGLWPNLAPTGYLNQKHMDKKCQVIIDPERAPIMKKMFEKIGYEKWSGRKAYHWLKFDLNFKTIGNKNLSLGNIHRILINPFYYGVFEYPKKSGNWYNGKHEPIISKELFELVQKQIKRENSVRQNHEFLFTKLMICGLCGSSISAEEKYKQRKDGTSKKYIYYGCCRSRDRNCKNLYLQEYVLIDQMIKIIDRVDFNETGVQIKFEEELKRHNRFQKGVLGVKDPNIKHEEIDLKSYAKYILKDGTDQEKRELMGCFKSRIKVTKGVITIE